MQAGYYNNNNNNETNFPVRPIRIPGNDMTSKSRDFLSSNLATFPSVMYIRQEASLSMK